MASVEQPNLQPTPEMTEIAFGASDLDWETEFPDKGGVVDLSKSTMLSKIYFKIFENTKSLVGIQLIFTNGFKSPMFETYYGKMQGRNNINRDWPILNTFVIDIDTSHTIS